MNPTTSRGGLSVTAASTWCRLVGGLVIASRQRSRHTLLGFVAGQLGQQRRGHDPGEIPAPARDLDAGQARGVARAGRAHEPR